MHHPTTPHDLLALLCAALLALAACGPAEESDDEAPGEDEPTEQLEQHICGAAAEPRVAVLRQLNFVQAEGDTSPGVDLDGVASDSDDPKGCYKPDFTSPDGLEGVDNQFSRLIPAIETVGGAEGFQSAIQRAINNGDVLLGIELTRLNDTQDDECVEVNLQRIADRPTVGALGLIEPGQTFDRDLEAPSSRVEDAVLADGTLVAGPFDLELPMRISNFDLLVTIRDARLELELLEDGSMQGVLAGAIEIQEMLDLLDEIEDGTDLLKVIRRVLLRSADLAPDDEGRCQRISLVAEVDAVPAFFFDDAPAADTTDEENE